MNNIILKKQQNIHNTAAGVDSIIHSKIKAKKTGSGSVYRAGREELD